MGFIHWSSFSVAILVIMKPSLSMKVCLRPTAIAFGTKITGSTESKE